jgi:hypothetical protein
MVRYHVAVVRELFVQIAHLLSCSPIFRFRSFRISAGDLMRVLNALDTRPYSPVPACLLPSAAKARSMDRTVFINDEVSYNPSVPGIFRLVCREFVEKRGQ